LIIYPQEVHHGPVIFFPFSALLSDSCDLLSPHLSSRRGGRPHSDRGGPDVLDGEDQHRPFSGNVDARQQDVRIRSDEMTVYYTALDTAAGKKGKKASQKVQKIICTGNVEVSKKEWLGTSKKMIYLEKERQVILLEDAKAYQGQNMVSGEKIVYYMDEGRSEVVGGKRTSTTVGDKGKGGKKPSRVNMTIIQK